MGGSPSNCPQVIWQSYIISCGPIALQRLSLSLTAQRDTILQFLGQTCLIDSYRHALSNAIQEFSSSCVKLKQSLQQNIRYSLLQQLEDLMCWPNRNHHSQSRFWRTLSGLLKSYTRTNHAALDLCWTGSWAVLYCWVSWSKKSLKFSLSKRRRRYGALALLCMAGVDRSLKNRREFLWKSSTSVTGYSNGLCPVSASYISERIRPCQLVYPLFYAWLGRVSELETYHNFVFAWPLTILEELEKGQNCSWLVLSC